MWICFFYKMYECINFIETNFIEMSISHMFLTITFCFQIMDFELIKLIVWSFQWCFFKCYVISDINYRIFIHMSDDVHMSLRHKWCIENCVLFHYSTSISVVNTRSYHQSLAPCTVFCYLQPMKNIVLTSIGTYKLWLPAPFAKSMWRRCDN